MKKRCLYVIFLLLLCWQTLAAAAPIAPTTSAEAGIMIDGKTQQVLYSKDADKIMYPASTTKMLTLLIALERGKLDSIVTVSKNAASTEESNLGIHAGDKLPLRDLLTGMMLVSGNDAAVAAAEHIAGSVPAFAKLMNEKADQLGAVNSHFSNPNGLPDPYNHFSTASDLAKIAAAGMQNPEFAKIVATPSYTVHFLNRPPLFVKNIDKFLRIYPGANGIKTGYTDAAGDCLAAGAKRNGVELIVVLLNDDERWDDSIHLMNYGFQLKKAL
ncbi:MAG: D-alanyl-D-alanine carboxypeptidase family protein [Sporomusaceae bacterium]|nr:D-alanyl-D-alanine carboxypeptidase family protein [Sporomusaceae bacterium]